MEQDFKKLILGDCEITEAGCHVIADIVKVKRHHRGVGFAQEHEVFQEVQDHN